MADSLVHDLLLNAGSDAKVAYEYNLGKPNHMRISRVGQPLVSLLLEDFVFSKLPELPKKQLTERQKNQEKVKRVMAQATGYLFEQAVIDILKEQPNLEIKAQHKVNLNNKLTGTCDILAVNTEEARATVIECKALKYNTKKEACYSALFNDSATGYLSQLAVYREAIQQEYGLYDVQAYWMVWCKGSAQLFKVPFEESGYDATTVVATAMDKVEAYANFKLMYEAKDSPSLLFALTDRLHTLPLRQPYFSGYSAACSAHYSPWSALLLDVDGVPFDDAKDFLELMLKVSLQNDGQAKETLLQLMKEHQEGT
jgi:hypothetical protein